MENQNNPKLQYLIELVAFLEKSNTACELFYAEEVNSKPDGIIDYKAMQLRLSLQKDLIEAQHLLMIERRNISNLQNLAA
jgi:hypothetical protein